MKLAAWLGSTVEGKKAALAVACAELVAIGWFFASVDIGKFEWNWITALLVFLFVVAFGGLIASAYGIKIKTLSSVETDQKAMKAFSAFMRRVSGPVLVVLMLYLSYLVWVLSHDLRIFH